MLSGSLSNLSSTEMQLEHSGYYGEQLKASIGFNPYEYWPLRLLFLVLGYATVVLPVYIVIRIVKKKCEGNDFQFRKNSFFRFLRLFAIGRPELRQEYQLVERREKSPGASSPNTHGKKKRDQFFNDCSTLFFYFTGIQVTLVCMGFFQERIITQGYTRASDPFILDKFGDSQFLVFCNRIVALILVGMYLMYDWRRQPDHVPPLYTHSFISFSNTISSWCQYEALKFVSFPTQTVCKASKLIPTMLMGRVVRKQRYSLEEYAEAFILAAGACIFFLSSQTPSGAKYSHSLIEKTTHFSGLILMAGYLIFDAFTPNWQKSLFDTRPRISRYQMMFGVNVFSAILCFASLVEQGSLVPSLKFMFYHDGFSRDVFLLSLCSASGQLFIYATIEKFGPEVFAVIMTLRQIFSIVLSSIYFSHPMSATGILGLFIVFGAIFYNIYRRYFHVDKSVLRYFKSNHKAVRFQPLRRYIA